MRHIYRDDNTVSAIIDYTHWVRCLKVHSDCARRRVRSVSAEYVSHVFELGIDARSLNEPLNLRVCLWINWPIFHEVV
jgi:hypothetical protein